MVCALFDLSAWPLQWVVRRLLASL